MKTHLEVSLCKLQTILVVGTFDRGSALTGNVLAVATVLFRKTENGVDGLGVWSRS